MDGVLRHFHYQFLSHKLNSLSATQIVKFLLLSLLIVIVAPIIETLLYLFSFNYVVYEDFVSWYFPVGFRVICYLFLPLRYWPALTIGFTLGQIFYVWYYYDVALDNLCYRLLSSASREYMILTPLILAKLLKVRLDIKTLRSAVSVIFIAISYRFIRSMLIVLPEGTKNKYALIAAEDRFEMMLAHQLGGILTTLLLLLLAFYVKTLFEQRKYLLKSKNIMLAFQLTLCFMAFYSTFLIEPKSVYLLRMLAIFPLLWFSFQFGALGALSYGTLTAVTLLVNVFAVNETELLLTTQLYLISYSVLALLLSALITELNHSKGELLKQNQELVTLSALTQNLATKVVHVQESERSQLSQELHDDIGQNLTALKTNIAILAKKTQHHDELSNTITRLENVSSTMYDSVYRLMHWLRPRLLDELGLAAALQSELFSEHLAEAGIAYQCHITGPINDLSDEFQIAIFRICQEASTNAVKHSLATQLEVNITLNNDLLTITINDNGIGLNGQQQLESKSGFGMDGIRERVSLLNGNCQFTHNVSGGLAINIHFDTHSLNDNGQC